jgi:cytochrome c-type biogenesis protein CcmF
MIAHPPILYMGYVGFSVAFAFAIAALLGGDVDVLWAAWCRPWATFAWIFLTCGIALGSFWAYYELGWGGWWFWDPVENASFMPWLAGTALIHSLAVTERRGSFKSWTILLAIATFSLSLLGTFLVRSGVLTSVHAFASDPKRGVFILSFLAAVIGGSLLLYAVRAKRMTANQTFDVVSRESMLLSNNVLLLVAAASILLGTLYPLVIDVLGMGKLSVGPPYFNAIFVSVMTPAMFLLGVGPIARWKSARAPELAARLRWAFVVSMTSGILAPFLLGPWKPLVALGLSLAFWILGSIVVSFRERLRKSGLRQLPRSYYGMQVAHAGVAVFILGVTIVSGYEVEHETPMDSGETVHVAGYDFTLKEVSAAAGANYIAAKANVEVADGGVVRLMRPEKRIYRSSTNPMTEAAIDSGVFRDLYIALGEPIENGGWTVRIQYKPFVNWIWGGALLMAIGGALSVRRAKL